MEDYKYKLSIIVPIYNVEKYLEECINSLLRQDIPHDDYEIILVDDGSTDNSYDIAKRFASEHDNIRLFSQENQGQSVARNKGIEVANSKYIMFVDSDDWIYPNILGRLLITAIDNKLDVCVFRIMIENENGIAHKNVAEPFETYKVYSGTHVLIHGGDVGSVCCRLYSKIMLDKYNLRFYPGIYHQDSEFNARVYAYIHRMMFTDVFAYHYRYVAGSITRKPNKQKYIKLIHDDIVVVRNIKKFAAKEKEAKLLRKFYQRHTNSLLVSSMLTILRSGTLSYEDKLYLLNTIKELGLLPMKGSTLSWKTTLLLPLFSSYKIYRKMLTIGKE